MTQALGFQVLLNLARVVLCVWFRSWQVTGLGPAQHVQVAGGRQLPRVGPYLWLPLGLTELIVALKQELTEVGQLYSGNGLRVDVALIKGLVRFLLVLLDLRGRGLAQGRDVMLAALGDIRVLLLEIQLIREVPRHN